MDLTQAILTRKAELITLEAAQSLLTSDGAPRPTHSGDRQNGVKHRNTDGPSKMDMVRLTLKGGNRTPLHVKLLQAAIRDRFGTDMPVRMIASYCTSHPNEFKRVAPNTFVALGSETSEHNGHLAN
jgi:hypothetical protein